jgi:SOS-response transcriptional repressor LexA
MSMAPRIEHTEKALVRLDPDVPPGHIVIAKSPQGKRFLKKLARNNGQLELQSLNKSFGPIRDLAGWELEGGVTAILHTYETGKPNYEWDDGRFLKA